MQDNWYEAVVTRQEPYVVVSVVDWASDWASDARAPEPTQRPPATYNVFAFGINDPSEGNRSFSKERFDPLASPLGWHVIPVGNNFSNDKGYKNYTTTIGNNVSTFILSLRCVLKHSQVFAHENWEGHDDWPQKYRPDGGEQMVFNFPYDPKPTIEDDLLDEARKYIDSAITQVFYTSNLVHDLYYR
jgi:extracellular elastinolytic metalloproteinase